MKFSTLLVLLLCSGQAVLAQVNIDPMAPIAIGQGIQIDTCDAIMHVRDGEVNPGPSFTIKTDPKISTVPFASLKTFKLMNFNEENLLEKPGETELVDGKKVYEPGPLDKPLDHSLGVLKTIDAVNPDFKIGVEVQSLDATEKLDRLDTPVRPKMIKTLIPGNDHRAGINIEFEFRQDLALDYVIQSYRNLTHIYMGRKERLFSRDFPVVLIYEQGKVGQGAPLFILAGVHAKSQHASSPEAEAADPGSIIKRTDQMKMKAKILNDLQEKYPGVHIIFAGDFNHDLLTGPEFQVLRDSGFVDGFDVAKIPEGADERMTEIYFSPDGVRHLSQLDAQFMDAALALKGALLGIKTILLDQHGNVLPFAKTFAEREKQPSDHHAVVGEYDVQLLLAKPVQH